MSSRPKDRMTVEEYLAWSDALNGAARARGLPCHVLPDGMAIRVGARTVFEPTALVYCGPELPADARLVENPLVVAEIISPTTGRNDHTRKLAGYFALPSIRHYLIVDPDERLVVHHERRDDGVVISHILTEGVAKLDPPGVELPLSELYGL